MNPYKNRKVTFLGQYFPYPEELERSIRSIQPVYFYSMDDRDPLAQLKRFDSIGRLTELFNHSGYFRHFNWGCRYRGHFILHDWCALYWEPQEGLYIHFEWLSISDTRKPDGSSCKYDNYEVYMKSLIRRREKILKVFLNGSLYLHYPDEDFIERVTDEHLTR